MKKRKRFNFHPLHQLRAKLSFDDGFAEKPIYHIKARTTEKEKGINMLELIEDNFNISLDDREVAFRKKMEEFQANAMTPTEVSKEVEKKQVKWTRDGKGNIVSPFRSKKKLL